MVSGEMYKNGKLITTEDFSEEFCSRTVDDLMPAKMFEHASAEIQDAYGTERLKLEIDYDQSYGFIKAYQKTYFNRTDSNQTFEYRAFEPSVGK